MTHVVSTINLKGGVGKTTTTVALAETLSATMSKRVLIIDLDPQTNATTMLIGEDRWSELNGQEHTLARFLKTRSIQILKTKSLTSMPPCKNKYRM